MTLLLDFDNEQQEIEINNAKELKDNLFMYAGYFVPEDDDYAIDLLEKLDFVNLLEELDNYFVKSFFEIAKEYFNLYEKLLKEDNMDELIKNIDYINELYDKSGLGVKYSIK